MRDLTNIQSAVARAVNAIKDLVAACAAKDAEIASLQAQAVADAAVIADLTAQLEAAIPDLGGSMGGVA